MLEIKVIFKAKILWIIVSSVHRQGRYGSQAKERLWEIYSVGKIACKSDWMWISALMADAM